MKHEWEVDGAGHRVVRDIGEVGYHENMVTCSRCRQSRCVACIEVAEELGDFEDCDGDVSPLP